MQKKKNYDLLLFGKESIDSNGAQIPAMVAEMLDIPFISFATSLEIEGNRAKLKREISGGTEVLTSSLPLSLSAQKGLAEWRIPNMRGIAGSKSKPLSVIPAFAVNPMTQTKKYELPPPKTGCNYIDAGEVGKLVKVLVEKGVL